MIFLAAFATAACAGAGATEVVVTALGDDTMELKYSTPMEQWRDAVANFEIELRSRCPGGYEKLAQMLDFSDGKSDYIWQVRCL